MKMKLNLGCGRDKKVGYFGIDCQRLPGVDLVCDCNDRIPLPNECAEEILAINFIEHIRNDKRIHIMEEIHRLLMPGGTTYILVPDAEEGQGAYMDPTHYSFWTIGSFKYYTDDVYRALYDIKAKFKILELRKDRVLGKENSVVYIVAKLEKI